MAKPPFPFLEFSTKSPQIFFEAVEIRGGKIPIVLIDLWSSGPLAWSVEQMARLLLWLSSLAKHEEGTLDFLIFQDHLNAHIFFVRGSRDNFFYS